MNDIQIGKLYRIKNSMRGLFAFKATRETESIIEEKPSYDSLPEHILASSTHGPHRLHGKVVLILTKKCRFDGLIHAEFVKVLHVDELIWLSTNSIEEIT